MFWKKVVFEIVIVTIQKPNTIFVANFTERHFAFDGSSMTHLVRQPGLEPVESGEFALKGGECGCGAITGKVFPLWILKIFQHRLDQLY